jgi:hypothetical protein
LTTNPFSAPATLRSPTIQRLDEARIDILFSCNGGAIDWRTAKQKTVMTSSTEGELLSLSCAAKEMIWWRLFFAAVRFHTGEDEAILCDNQQIIRILQKDAPKLITKLRHVDIHGHWLRQEVSSCHGQSRFRANPWRIPAELRVQLTTLTVATTVARWFCTISARSIAAVWR